QRHGGCESGAGGQRALSRRRSRREEHSRQCDLGRADQDAGGLGHRRFPLHPEMERIQRADAPHRDHGGGRRQRAVSVVGPVARRHWRGASRRFRLSRRGHEAAGRAGYLAGKGIVTSFAARDRDKWGIAAPSGESYASVTLRMREWFESLLADTVTVAHGGTMRALMVALGIATPLEAAETPIGQGVVYVFSEGRLAKYS